MTSPPEEVKAWLAKAGADLLAARILVQHSRLVLGPAAFHCQQAAEKALKAFLVWRSVPFERVHSLVYLMDLCEAAEPQFAALREDAVVLSPYAVEIRYPGEAIEISPQDALRALQATEAIWNQVQELLPSELRVTLPGEPT